MGSAPLSESSTSQILRIHLLSRLVLAPETFPENDEIDESGELWATADAHHVVLRAGIALNQFQQTRRQRSAMVLVQERARIAKAIQYLAAICHELEACEIRVAVIKSLDHWPDFGSDMDLFTDSKESDVSARMRSGFGAEIVPPTFADRLANKVNYRIPGLPELVEVHFGRLGQTGEHVKFAGRILERRGSRLFGGTSLPVPAVEEQLILTVLQRMYRHFYIRICDFANTAQAVDSGDVDFDELRHASKQAGIWPGVATYLQLVSQYMEHYRGHGLRLPYRALHASRFGLTKVYPHAGFLRLPLFPQAASLYTSQLIKSVRRDPVASLRLSLLPPLAAMAGAKYKITGSNKGVW